MSFFSKQIDKRIAAYQRELIETHYREVENMYRQIRGWRHDYRNHIQMMKVLAANGDMDALKAYLDELDHTYSDYIGSDVVSGGFCKPEDDKQRPYKSRRRGKDQYEPAAVRYADSICNNRIRLFHSSRHVLDILQYTQYSSDCNNN